jgi:hypothetical protein
MLYIFIFSKYSLGIIFSHENLLTLSSTFFPPWKMCEIEASSPLQHYSSTSSICLYLYIHTPFPRHDVHIINHTSSHHHLFVVPISTYHQNARCCFWQVCFVFITFHSRAHGTFITQPSIPYACALMFILGNPYFSVHTDIIERRELN